MSLITAYNPLPIAFTHGEGVWLFDEKGQAYLDTFSGIAVCNLGHAHPAVTKAIQEQAAKLLHTSNMVHILKQDALAERLTSLAHMEQVFFCNSGCEANEAAIKLARLYGHQRGIETPTIIVMEGAFHGRTMATLTASGGRKAQAGFEPLVSGFVRAPFNDLAALKTIASNRQDIVAVLMEPIQGEGGIIAADEAYMQDVATFCEQQDWLLMLDEVQTGNARTGPLFACIGLGIQPDVLTTAKGLGNGMPIGACLMSKRACNLFAPGMHGSTFGGNPLACAAALAVLETIEKEGICEHVHQQGKRLKNKLVETFSHHPHVRAIRGKGFMLGLALDKPAAMLRLIGLKHGLVINVTAEKVIRLLPPLILDEEGIDWLVERLLLTINDFYSQS